MAKLYAGARNVANDTITNIVYGGLLRAQTDRTMGEALPARAGIAPEQPSGRQFLGDLAYNRGPGLLKTSRITPRSRDRCRRIRRICRGTRRVLRDHQWREERDRHPRARTDIDKTGKNSVLERSSEAVGRVKFSKKLTEGLGDRNGDGRIDHLDV